MHLTSQENPHPLTNCRLSAELPDEPLVCIVKFREDLQFGLQIPQTPAVHVQVTVRADNCSPGGRYIRFGYLPDGTRCFGDELTGWMVREYLEVCEVLGALQADGKTVLPARMEDDAFILKTASGAI